MPTEYNEIAEHYRSSKQVPWRFHIEQHSFLNVVGGIRGKTILDLACGEGHYTRLLKSMGAARTLGVDLSSKMIELAREAECHSPLGVEYECADARALRFAETFDIVSAAYLLNYARTKDELLDMCRAISRYLKPGGRFVAVNNNPAQAVEAFANTRKYGFIKIAGTMPLEDGTPVRYKLFLEKETFEIENYYLSVATHEAALRECGLSGVRWHPMRLAPNEAAANHDYWADFFIDPPVVIIEAVKESRA